MHYFPLEFRQRRTYAVHLSDDDSSTRASTTASIAFSGRDGEEGSTENPAGEGDLNLAVGVPGIWHNYDLRTCFAVREIEI